MLAMESFPSWWPWLRSCARDTQRGLSDASCARSVPYHMDSQVSSAALVACESSVMIGSSPLAWSNVSVTRPVLVFTVTLRQQRPATCKCWNLVVGVSPIILAGVFFLFWLLKSISGELVEEEHPLINRVIAKESTA